MKFKTKGLTMAAVSVLAMGAMVSTGFATWVITGKESETKEASIGVDAQVKYVDIVELEANKDLDLFFGPNTTNTEGWLQSSVTTATDLDAQISFQVKGTAGGTVEVKNLTFEEKAVTIGSNANQKPYKTASDAGLVCALPTLASSEPDANAKSYATLTVDNTYLDGQGDQFTLSNATPGLATLTFKLKLNWGTAFGEVNPLDYYNAHSQDSLVSGGGKTYAQDALENLTSAAFANLAYAKFTLSFTLESIIPGASSSSATE